MRAPAAGETDAKAAETKAGNDAGDPKWVYRVRTIGGVTRLSAFALSPCERDLDVAASPCSGEFVVHRLDALHSDARTVPDRPVCTLSGLERATYTKTLTTATGAVYAMTETTIGALCTDPTGAYLIVACGALLIAVALARPGTGTLVTGSPLASEVVGLAAVPATVRKGDGARDSAIAITKRSGVVIIRVSWR